MKGRKEAHVRRIKPTKQTGRTLLAFGCVHFPYQSAPAVEVLCRVAEYLRPDLTLCLGDLLDCSQFSQHPPTFHMPESKYEDDLIDANALLDRLQAASGRVVMIAGLPTRPKGAGPTQ